MSSYDIGGWIKFKGKKSARNQAELERTYKNLLLRVLVLVDTEIPNITGVVLEGMTEQDYQPYDIFAEMSTARKLSLETRIRQTPAYRRMMKHCPFGKQV